MKKTKKLPEASIQVIFKNEEEHIASCISSILNQGFRDFELVLIGNPSTDRSDEIVMGFKDPRIKYHLLEKDMTIAGARDFGLKLARGKYIFFTDADCVAQEDWLDAGLRILKSGYLGVEGKIIYMNKTPTVSDKVVENYGTERGMTANIGYHADIIKGFGFNHEMKNMMEDRELYHRVMQKGKVTYCEDMVVSHQAEKWTYRSLVNRHKAQAFSKVYLYKHFKDRSYTKLFFAFPNHLATLLFPPLLIIKAVRDKVKSWQDLAILFYYYIAYLAERIEIWKAAISMRVFIL